MSQQGDTAKISKMDTKYQKIYRAMVELGKKLDDIYKSENAFMKIFHTETTLYRENDELRLQRYCETLIFREPIECGKKAEEILWRRVFYEIIHIVKSNKKNLKANAQIETMYRLHLSSAYGFYNHLVLKFQTEFSSVIKLDGFLDFPLLSHEKQPLPSNLQENPELLREVLTRILVKFLICLGDLSRYQIEYDPASCPRLAHKYYQMSLFLVPQNGMPLNQLGTLYGSENYGCDAAFYYLYSLSCGEQFVSARTNLKLLFSKNRKRYDEIKSAPKFIDREKCADFSDLRIKEIKKFLVLFLHIVDSILSGDGNQHLQELCQVCLQDFNSLMFYRSDENAAKLSYLPDDLIFKLTLTILMAIEQLKKKSHGFSGKALSSVYFTTVAFALIFFSHIVNHAIIRLQEALLGDREKPVLSCGEEEEEGAEETKREESEEAHSGKEEVVKKKIRLLYGNRRRKHNSDSETGESKPSGDESSEEERRSQSSRSRRSRSVKKPTKFLEREDLSETELNILSSAESSSSETTDSESGSNSSTTSSSSTQSEAELEKLVQAQAPMPQTAQAAVERVDFEDAADPYSNNTHATINFKEFSSQLYSRLSMLHAQPAYSITNPAPTDEFIDNEVYKFVLNGRKEVDIPPGFEVNAKEVQEIEELGKKLATFQIETDTEMSLYNTEEEGKSGSGSDECEEEEEEVQKGKKGARRIGSAGKSCEEKSSKKKANKSSQKKSEFKNAKVLVSLLQQEALLPTIKVFCDWLLCNKKIIQSISQVSTTIWSKLAVLLNCIPLEKQIASEAICENSYVRGLILKSSETKSWNCQPLSEDVQMRSFGALRLEHSFLTFDINKLNQLNAGEENLLRLCHLRRFGYLITSLSRSQSAGDDSASFFEYDADKALFIAPNSAHQTKLETKSVSDTTTTPTTTTIGSNKEPQQNESRKLQLMKNMAQLRLEAEISQLESSYKSEETNWPPYLVPDTFALCENLKIAQEISRTCRFIMIIPLVVIDHLDSIKKESRQAREVIRWLENQFKQGNRFLRAQTHNEKFVSNYEANLKKKDLDQWRFCQLIDCCKYFQQESSANNADKNSMVSLLMNEELNDSKVKQKLAIANENQIELTNVREFYDKWKKANVK